MQPAGDVGHTAPTGQPADTTRTPLRRHIPNRIRNQWPSLSVQTLVFVSVAAIAIDFRVSVGLLAAALALALALRIALPKRRIGWLEVRRKKTDLACLGLLLLGVVGVALTTPLK